MHSLYAVAGIPGYGAAVSNDIFCHALARIADDPASELREYLRRDILNLALRNTDNHGRNTAILRAGGQIALAPLFDFAPMFLDPEGIGRVSRWEAEAPGNQPAWRRICETFRDILPFAETRRWLADLGWEVQRLPALMRQCGVDDDIVQRLAGWIDDVASGLADT